jgi:hypothetical protein
MALPLPSAGARRRLGCDCKPLISKGLGGTGLVRAGAAVAEGVTSGEESAGGKRGAPGSCRTAPAPGMLSEAAPAPWAAWAAAARAAAAAAAGGARVAPAAWAAAGAAGAGAQGARAARGAAPCTRTQRLGGTHLAPPRRLRSEEEQDSHTCTSASLILTQ